MTKLTQLMLSERGKSINKLDVIFTAHKIMGITIGKNKIGNKISWARELTEITENTVPTNENPKIQGTEIKNTDIKGEFKSYKTVKRINKINSIAIRYIAVAKDFPQNIASLLMGEIKRAFIIPFCISSCIVLLIIITPENVIDTHNIAGTTM